VGDEVFGVCEAGQEGAPYFKTSGPPYCSMKAAFMMFCLCDPKPMLRLPDGAFAESYPELAIRQWPHL
jgi:hypothetical protein